MVWTNKANNENKSWEVTQVGCLEEKISVLPKGNKPMTLWLLEQIICHKATGDSWELRQQ